MCAAAARVDSRRSTLDAASASLQIAVADGVVLIRDANTTIGYCRHTHDGDIEYIFVNPAWRRRGVGRRLLAEVERRCGRRGRPLEPISPLGRRFFGLPGADAANDSPQRTARLP